MSVTVRHQYAAPTDKQIAYATSLAIKAGYPHGYALSAARRDMNGKNPVGDMKRQECSKLIEWLNAKIA